MLKLVAESHSLYCLELRVIIIQKQAHFTVDVGLEEPNHLILGVYFISFATSRVCVFFVASSLV